MSLIPKNEALPSSSRTSPRTVSERVKPSPIPIPSSAESATLFFDAKASALPRTMQFTTISGINIPRVA